MLTANPRAAVSLLLILQLGLTWGFVGGGDLKAFSSATGVPSLRDSGHPFLSRRGAQCTRQQRQACWSRISMMDEGADASGKNLPSGSIWEQREALNRQQVVREAAYEDIKRRIRASSYEFGEADYRRLFAQFDKDKNGSLSFKEFQIMCQRMGLKPWVMSDEEIRIMLEEIAESNGGDVGIMDFLHWMGQKVGVSENQKGGSMQGSSSSLPLDRQAGAWTYGASAILEPESASMSSPSPSSGWTYGASAVDIEGVEASAVQQVSVQQGSSQSGQRSSRSRKATASGDSLEDMVLSLVNPSVSVEDVRNVIYFLTMELQITDQKVLGMAISNPGIFEQDVDETLRYSIERLVDLGVPLNKVKKVVTSWPNVLEYGIDRWQDNIEYLGDFGLVGEKFGRCIALCPNILELSIEDNVMPTVDFLVVEGGVPLTKIGQVILAFPNILSYSVELNLRPKLKFIQEELGVPKEKVSSLLLKFPQIVGLSVESNIVPTVNFLVDQIGVDKQDVSKIVQQHPQVLGLSVQENLRSKQEFLLNEVGVPANKLASVVAAFPTLLSLSIAKNLRPKIQFLLDEAGYHIEDIIKSPNLLAYSLEQRIRPRYFFLRSRGIRIALGSMLSYSDKQFKEKFGPDGDSLPFEGA